MIQIMLTISCAYLSFYVAEETLQISGVLSCVSAGIVLSWLGPVIVLEHETMSSVWETIGWSANTLIFTLAGVLIGHIEFKVHSYDFIAIVVVYLLTQLIRVVMVAFFYPFLSWTGYGMSVREAAFVSWSGVRGAICITLALVVNRSTATNYLTVSAENGNQVFFVVGGVAALTLLVNGTGSKAVLLALGLVKRTTEVLLYVIYVNLLLLWMTF